MKGIIDHIKSTASKVYIGPKDEGVGSPRGRYHYADGSIGDVSKVAPTIDLVLSALDTGSHWNPNWGKTPKGYTRRFNTRKIGSTHLWNHGIAVDIGRNKYIVYIDLV